jgi:hypothetical protein
MLSLSARLKHRVWLPVPMMLCCLAAAVSRAEGPQVTLYEAASRQARQISSRSLAVPLSPAQWERSLPQRRTEWLRMLGLDPLPERTPLEATVTGTLERGDYVVEKVHFQSLPGAYVIGNLYRPGGGHASGCRRSCTSAGTRWAK